MEGIEIALIGRGELPVWGKSAPLRIGLMDNSPPTDTPPLVLLGRVEDNAIKTC